MIQMSHIFQYGIGDNRLELSNLIHSLFETPKSNKKNILTAMKKYVIPLILFQKNII